MIKKWNWKPYLLLIFAVGYTSIAMAETVNQPAATSASTKCKTKLTGEKFIGLIQDIISHGDLTDIPFIESTLQLKFNNYTSETVFDAPIHVDLYLRQNPEEQIKSHEIGFIRIRGQGFPSPDAEFITDCLHIHSTDVADRFGGGFHISPVTDGVPINEASKNMGNIGKNGSKFTLSYSYNYRNNDESINGLVNDFFIRQDP